jgi:hypothetical protein
MICYKIIHALVKKRYVKNYFSHKGLNFTNNLLVKFFKFLTALIHSKLCNPLIALKL